MGATPAERVPAIRMEAVADIERHDLPRHCPPAFLSLIPAAHTHGSNAMIRECEEIRL